MLKKQYRLVGKSVSFLLWKKKIYHGKFFSFSYFSYSRSHHRFSFHLSKKIHKSAVIRNFVKRQVLSSFVNSFDLNKSVLGQYYQFFVRANLKNLDDWKRLVENKEQKTISKLVNEWFLTDLKSFLLFLSMK